MMKNLRVPALIFAIIFIIGLWGLIDQESPISDPAAGLVTTKSIDAFFDKIYDSIKFFTLGYNNPGDLTENLFIDIARFAAAIIVLVTLLLAFDFFIPDNWRVHWHTWRGDHIVVCGAGTKGSTIVRKRMKDDNGKRKVIVIEKDKNNENLVALKEEGALVIVGDAKQEEILKKCNIGKAHSVHIYVNDDSSALAIFDTIKKFYAIPSDGKSKTPTERSWSLFYNKTCKCFVNILNSEICIGLKNSFSGVEDQYPRLKVYIINTDFVIGEAIFNAYKDQEIDFSSTETQRILFIVGTGSIVDYFIINYLHALYLIESNKTHGIYRPSPVKPIIAIIDPKSTEYLNYLKNRYPFLNNNCCTFQDLQYGVKSEEFLLLIKRLNQANLFVVCLPDDYQSIEAGLFIDEGLKRNTYIQKKVPVVVKIDEDISLNSTVVQMKYKYSTLRFISVKEKITNSHFPEYDLFSGLTEWARISPETWSERKTYSHNYVMNTNDKKTANLLMYRFLVDSDAPDHKEDYPDYLLNMQDRDAKVVSPELENFLESPDERILKSKPSFFDEYWKKIEDILPANPAEFYKTHEVSVKTQIRAAKLFVMQGIYDEAQKIVERISSTSDEYNLANAKSGSNTLDPDVLDFFLMRAKIFQNNGEIADAQAIYSGLANRGNSTECNVFIDLLLKINKVFDSEDHRQVISTLDEVINECSKYSGKRFSVLSMICHNMKGKRRMNLNEFDDAISSFRVVESSAAKSLDLKAITISYNNLGLGYTLKANNEANPELREKYFGVALKYHKEQEKLSAKINYKKGKQRAWGNSAIVYRMKANLKEAYDNHLLEEKECKGMGYALGLSSAYNNLAIIQILSKDRGSPRRNLNKQMILAHKLNETENKALCYGNYALMYYKKGQIYQALLLNEMAIRLSVSDPTYSSFVKIIKKLEDLPPEFHDLNPQKIVDFNKIIESVTGTTIVPGTAHADFIHDYYTGLHLQIHQKNIQNIDEYSPEIKTLAERLVETDFYLIFGKKVSYPDVDEDKARDLFESIADYPKETKEVFKTILKKAKNNKKIFLALLHGIEEKRVKTESEHIVLSVFDDLTPAPIIR